MGDQEINVMLKKTNSKRNGKRYSKSSVWSSTDRRRLENCNGKKNKILKEILHTIFKSSTMIEGDLKIVMVKKQILKEILHNIQIINMIEGDLKIIIWML
ncbi:unnamed protein product [Acanthoscelides obtectus]|uniref:Uncharacterized protein n=1 Tax=Acanthoscelides obtectus TaxID=200917 RepID=A0A9P0QC27_ACAOB|nr:unnamed protein product [Acanthoscelides obtectus]CAK1684709.1 hypothetical protein AOBTE_LOCUS35053 [Acanthoscelides obtectus]